MTQMYFRNADACILVYDVTDRDSFSQLKTIWLKDLLDKAPANIIKAIVGNKCDLAP
jgi:GTPase SAR1 family protein